EDQVRVFGTRFLEEPAVGLTVGATSAVPSGPGVGTVNRELARLCCEASLASTALDAVAGGVPAVSRRKRVTGCHAGVEGSVLRLASRTGAHDVFAVGLAELAPAAAPAAGGIEVAVFDPGDALAAASAEHRQQSSKDEDSKRRATLVPAHLNAP